MGGRGRRIKCPICSYNSNAVMESDGEKLVCCENPDDHTLLFGDSHYSPEKMREIMIVRMAKEARRQREKK